MPPPKKDYFFTLAHKRKTTYEFSDKKVKDSDIKKILEAARWAPSCSNIQPWHFIVVKNKKRISQLMKTTFYGAFHTDPAVIIAVVLKQECWAESNHICIKDSKLGYLEAFICIGQPALIIAFEAEELGVGSSLLSPNPPEAAKILKLRKGDAVHILVGLGYERKGAFQKKRARKELKELVSAEYFGGKTNL